MIFIKVCYIRKFYQNRVYQNIFNIVKINNDNNELTISIPNLCQKNSYKINKILKKTIKKLQKYNIRDVVLEEELNGINILKKMLCSNNINIIDGKIMYKYLLFEIINIVLCKTNKEMEKSEISVLLKNNSEIYLRIIKKIAKNAKIVKIVTSQIERFKKISQELYDELGIILIVGDNKKILQKSDIIVNVNFTEEEINKYIIPSNSVIINCEYKINVKSKKFNGVIINGLDICIPEKYKCNGISNLKAYETMLYKTNFKDIDEIIEKDNIAIKYLLGTKNIIEENDWKNILDKNKIVV